MPIKSVSRFYYDIFNSPVGNLLLVASQQGICQIHFLKENEEAQETLQKRYPEHRVEISILEFKKIKKELTDYFNQRLKTFSLPLKLKGTFFQKKVWQALSAIPYGKTLSYQDVAVRIGKPAAARAVGMACGQNPVAILIPCHRVIGKNGRLTGFGGGLEIKEKLLQLEKNHTKNSDRLSFFTGEKNHAKVLPLFQMSNVCKS